MLRGAPAFLMQIFAERSGAKRCMAEELDELKKLSPSERIAKLKELEEKRKKEIEEAEALIKESEREITMEEELKKIPIPQMKFFDISELSIVSPEGTRLAKHARFVREKTTDVAAEATRAGRRGKLEENVEKEAEERGITAASARAEQGVRYGKALEEAMMAYTRTSEIREKIERGAELSYNERREFERAGEEMREAHSQAHYIENPAEREKVDNMYSTMKEMEKQMEKRRMQYGY